MKTKLFLFLFFFPIILLAQEKFTVSGYLKDAASGEGLIGASVTAKGTTQAASANVYGFYSLTLPKGKHTLVFSYVGYQSYEQEIMLEKNITIDSKLNETSVELKTVEISSEREDANVKKIEMSVAKLDMKTIQKVPQLLGEVDVIRTIQLLPGVSTVGEGAQGFNVRGGSTDQNLILLDEAPVFNSSHLFGFFSVFNPDAVKDVKLVKGGIPAQYGGRLSSLLDVRMKEGNNQRVSVNGGVGIIFSRLSIEAPIIKDKASFIVAARRSYFDLFFPFAKNKAIQDAKANFYDLTAKTNYTINDKNRVFLSGYFGRDVFGQGTKDGFGFDWGNKTATARWNHIFNSKLFSNLTTYYSNYDYALGVGNKTDGGFKWDSKIINYSVKPEFTYYLNTKNTIIFGGQAIFYDFVPGTLTFWESGKENIIGSDDKYAIENGIYAGNEQTLNDKFSLQYGLRFSNFTYLGSGTSFTYRDTTPGIRKPLESETKFSKNEVIKNYPNLEPRFSVKYELNASSSIKASYNRMAQYIHLISNTAASTPLDVWTPSTNNIKPQLADQVAVGYFKNFGKNNMFEASFETYYKALQNQIDYIDNANLLLNKYLEQDLMNGKGRAYGAEVYLKKAKGLFTGWLSYTLARTERKVSGINLGDWYPTRFDKLHNVNLVLMYDITERLSVSANFVYASGTPVTFPTNRVEVQGYVVPHNPDEKRNNFRITPYHRLDVGTTYKFKKKRVDQRWESDITASVYNVYNRRNPFAIYFRSNPNDPSVQEAVRFSVVGSFIPSISYNFKF